jgi:hypothetical protein
MKHIGFAVNFAVIGLAIGAPGADIWWMDRDGGSGYFEAASWADLQSAIVSAQAGSASTGRVRISGDVARTNAPWTQLNVSAGGVVVVSGGWGWDAGSHLPTVQNGRSRIDANSAALASNIRVFNIASPDVGLDRLAITGGRLSSALRGAGIYAGTSSSRMTLDDCAVYGNTADTDYQDGGGGIRIDGGSGYRISRSIISNNTARLRGWGGGLFLSGVQSMVLDHSTVAANVATISAYDGFGGGLCLMGGSKVFIGNCELVNNRCRSGGSALYCVGGSMGGATATLFGTLVAGNRHDTDPNGTAVSAIVAASRSADGATVLVNSTVVSNSHGGLAAAGVNEYLDWQQLPLVSVNSVIEGRQMSLGYSAAHGDSWRNSAHMALQHTTIQVATNQGYAWADYGVHGVGVTNWAWHYTNTLAEALAAVDHANTNRFHGIRESGVLTQGSEQNNEDDPGLLGANAKGVCEYSLADPSPCIDSGRTALNGGSAYVDVNRNGRYDALTDVLVAGADPGSGHFYYPKDLAGNPRLTGRFIDRGAYESPSLPGAVLTIR